MLELRRGQRPRDGADVRSLRRAARRRAAPCSRSRCSSGIVVLGLLLQAFCVFPRLFADDARRRAFALDAESLDVLRAALERLEEGFAGLPAADAGRAGRRRRCARSCSRRPSG